MYLRHNIKKTPFLRCIFQPVSTFVVSTWETPQAYTEPLQDLAPTFSNTDFPKSWHVLTKLNIKMQEYGQYAGNFDQNPQMTKYRLKLASCHQWKQNSEKMIYAFLQHRKRLFNLQRWKKNKLSKNVERKLRVTQMAQNMYFFRKLRACMCFVRAKQVSQVANGSPVVARDSSWTQRV